MDKIMLHVDMWPSVKHTFFGGEVDANRVIFTKDIEVPLTSLTLDALIRKELLFNGLRVQITKYDPNTNTAFASTQMEHDTQKYIDELCEQGWTFHKANAEHHMLV